MRMTAYDALYEPRLRSEEVEDGAVEGLGLLVGDEMIALDDDQLGIGDVGGNQACVLSLDHIVGAGDDQCLSLYAGQ